MSVPPRWRNCPRKGKVIASKSLRVVAQALSKLVTTTHYLRLEVATPTCILKPLAQTRLPLDKFLPFKCPLSTEYDRDLDESQRFHPSMLVAYTESVERRMGLVVDLTKTDRYYDKRELLQSGIGHHKIVCAGLVMHTITV